MKCEAKVFLTGTFYVTVLTVIAGLSLVLINNDAYGANSNSEEVEKIAEQNQDCNISICTNIVTQSQTASASITNAGSASLDDVDNSAEVEQKTQQENQDCDVSICENERNQFQVASAFITNTGNVNLDDVDNSAEVEQKTQQENQDCDVSICDNFGNQFQVSSAIITNDGDGDYEDEVHLRFVRLCAYRLAERYVGVGRRSQATELIRWLEENDTVLR